MVYTYNQFCYLIYLKILCLLTFDFFKRISYINLSKKGIESIGEKVINLATYEGLDGHAKSVKLRIGE